MALFDNILMANCAFLPYFSDFSNLVFEEKAFDTRIAIQSLRLFEVKEMKIGNIFDSSGRQIGTVESDSGSGSGADPRLVFAIKFLGFFGLLYLLWDTLLSDYYLHSCLLARMSCFSGPDDLPQVSGLAWLVPLWKDGSIRERFEVIQIVSSIGLPVILGFIVGVFFGVSMVSTLIGYLSGIGTFLVTNGIVCLINCIFDRGVFELSSMYGTYFLCAILNIFCITMPLIAYIVAIEALGGIWETIASFLEIIFPFLP